MDPFCCFPGKGTFSRDEVFQIMNNNLEKDVGQSDQIFLSATVDPFIEYGDELK